MSNSAWCATARSVLRCFLFDGSPVFFSGRAEPLGSPDARCSHLGVHVVLPSAWMRNEYICSSFASRVACRIARRAARLKFGRPFGFPEGAVKAFVDEDLISQKRYQTFSTTTSTTNTFKPGQKGQESKRPRAPHMRKATTASHPRASAGNPYSVSTRTGNLKGQYAHRRVRLNRQAQAVMQAGMPHKAPVHSSRGRASAHKRQLCHN